MKIAIVIIVIAKIVIVRIAKDVIPIVAKIVMTALISAQDVVMMIKNAHVVKMTMLQQSMHID